MKFLIIVFMLRGRSSLAILVSLVLVSGLFLINVTVDDAFAGKDEKRVMVSGVDTKFNNKVKIVSCLVGVDDGPLVINLSGNGGGSAAGFVPKATLTISGTCEDAVGNVGNITSFPLRPNGMTKVPAIF